VNEINLIQNFVIGNISRTITSCLPGFIDIGYPAFPKQLINTEFFLLSHLSSQISLDDTLFSSFSTENIKEDFSSQMCQPLSTVENAVKNHFKTKQKSPKA